MKIIPKTGCIIKNKKDPYQFHCVFSTDPEDKRDFSVYFHSPDGRQEIMASCTHNERYECTFAHKGLSLTEEYITVSETFSAQNGSFVCRDGGAPLEQFPCLYSGNSVKPEVKSLMTDIGSNTLHKPHDLGTQDNNLAVIIVMAVVIIIQAIAIGFLLWKIYKSKKDTKSPEGYIPIENNISTEDQCDEQSKSCNGETRETEEENQENGNGISLKDSESSSENEQSKLLPRSCLYNTSMTCNYEPRETQDVNQQNRIENNFSTQDQFDEQSKSCNGETRETEEDNQENGHGFRLKDSASSSEEQSIKFHPASLLNDLSMICQDEPRDWNQQNRPDMWLDYLECHSRRPRSVSSKASFMYKTSMTCNDKLKEIQDVNQQNRRGFDLSSQHQFDEQSKSCIGETRETKKHNQIDGTMFSKEFFARIAQLRRRRTFEF